MSPARVQTTYQFAAIIPVGPGPIGTWRAIELIKGLLLWQPDLACCILIDDSPQPSGISELKLFSCRCRVITLRNLRQGTDSHWIAGLSASVLQALSWIQRETDVDFVLRIDADALVIRSFATFVGNFIANTPDTGVIGTLGLSSNPEVRMRQDLSRESKFITAYRLWPTAADTYPDLFNDGTMSIHGFDVPVTRQARRSFDHIRPHVAQAMRYGFASSEYCQGGALVVTRAMMDRMATHGFLDHPEIWLPLRVADDLILAMYARAVRLRLCDLSGAGEPFGVQHRGLPAEPEELARRGHAIIHSVKNDRHYTEYEIRRFFRARQHTTTDCGDKALG